MLNVGWCDDRNFVIVAGFECDVRGHARNPVAGGGRDGGSRC